ncbi:hypothetical protein B0H19DRAFT_1158264 [Mycena capillaripes]|nr:hypothetical protein B0H19DRAFT_1158264 [Mycena capillaripes]
MRAQWPASSWRPRTVASPMTRKEVLSPARASTAAVPAPSRAPCASHSTTTSLGTDTWM